MRFIDADLWRFNEAVERSVVSEDERFEEVRKLYLRVLGREPDPDGQAHYAATLRSGVMTLDEIEALMLASEEYARWVLRSLNVATVLLRATMSAVYGAGFDPAALDWGVASLQGGASVEHVMSILIPRDQPGLPIAKEVSP